MTKSEEFFRFLITRFEQIHSSTGKKVVYFDKQGNEVPDDDSNCKWWVSDEGVVYDNEEKVSAFMAKYDANLGMLY